MAGEIAAEFHDRQGKDKDVQVHITRLHHPEHIAAIAAEWAVLREQHQCIL